MGPTGPTGRPGRHPAVQNSGRDRGANTQVVLITPLCDDDEASRIAQRFESGGTAVRVVSPDVTTTETAGDGSPGWSDASAEHATERRYSRRRLDTHPQPLGAAMAAVEGWGR